MIVEINYQVKTPQKYEALFNNIAQKGQKKLKLKSCNISCAMVSSSVMKKLNNRYRSKNKDTDVLSFPEINEIVISLAKAKKQAKDKNHSLNRELSFLFAHGFLHLFGFDHQTDQEEKIMNKLTEEIIKGDK